MTKLWKVLFTYYMYYIKLIRLKSEIKYISMIGALKDSTAQTLY